jgi:hypothetical protein
MRVSLVPLVTSLHSVALPLNPLKLATSLEVMAETHFRTTGSRSCGCAACGLNPVNSRPGGGESSKTSKTQSHSKMEAITSTDQGESSRTQGKGTTGSPQTIRKGKEPERDIMTGFWVANGRDRAHDLTGRTVPFWEGLRQVLTHFFSSRRERHRIRHRGFVSFGIRQLLFGGISARKLLNPIPSC